MSDPTPEQSTMRRMDSVLHTLRGFWRLWGFLAFLVLVVVLFRGILLPFVFAVILTYLLGPIVDRLQPRIGRVLGVILCYIIILGALYGFFGSLVPALVQDLAKLRDALPAAAATLN